MYEIIWTPRAKYSYFDTLKYWRNHNKSNTYSNKIVNEVDLVLVEILSNPSFLATYSSKLNLYKKNFFKGKFALYYEIKNDKIIIEYFRSNKQKPL
ncbi:MAG: plasmid stabilization protein ParE [Flavobacteriales bacterium]|nr:MAG: plasmid stabilization protein ParE [Flavobacteriales bacterium]